MKNTRTTAARLLPLLAMLLVSPFGLWSCEDAGDEPDGPTGPVSQYNPVMDAAGSKITVKIEGATVPGQVYQGGEFTLVAQIRGGDGQPIAGVPLTAQAETGTGDVLNYFTIVVSPSITNAQGRASFDITVTPDCPVGSYTFVVTSSPGTVPVSGPTAMGTGSIRVVPYGSFASGAITNVVVDGGAQAAAVGQTESYHVSVTATPGCTPVVGVSFGAAFADPGSDRSLEHTWSAAGTFFVRARAACSGVAPWTESDPYQVVVG